MKKYNSLDEELYHQDTLYGLLDVKTSDNNVYKSLKVTKIVGGTAYIEGEPYDDAYDIDKASRVLNRRRKFICNSLDVDCLSVTYYDEWSVKRGELIFKEDKK